MRTFVVDGPRSSALRALNYDPELEMIRRKGSKSALQLGSLLASVGDSYWAVFTRRDCTAEFGVELLTQVDMFAAEPAGRVIRRDSMQKPELHRVRKWQILIAGAGQMGEGNLFGQSIIADSRLTHGYLGPHAVALTFDEPGSDINLWTYAFLNTRVGRSAVKTCAFGTSIPGLRLDMLRQIPVPVAPTETVSRVASLVRSAVASREAFLASIRSARLVIDEAPEMKVAHEMCAERRSRQVLWGGPFPSLCSWNFASTGGALAYLRSRCSARLSDFVEEGGIYRGARYARIPCAYPYGVDFMSQRDAFLIRSTPQRVLLPSCDLSPTVGTIMVGGQGTLGEGEIFGRAVMVSEEGAKAAWTEHLLRIVPRAGSEAYLYAFLTTTVGFRLLRSTAVGTKLLSMRPDLLLDLPVPVLSDINIARVNTAVQGAITARMAADAAESEAIRIIEREVLPKWLA